MLHEYSRRSLLPTNHYSVQIQISKHVLPSSTICTKEILSGKLTRGLEVDNCTENVSFPSTRRSCNIETLKQTGDVELRVSCRLITGSKSIEEVAVSAPVLTLQKNKCFRTLIKSFKK